MSVVNPRTDRYNYEVFAAALEESVRHTGSAKALRQLCKLKFMALAIAYADFDSWRPETDKEKAIAQAWEDVVIAFSAYGDATLTGVIMDLWNSMPETSWPDVKKALNAAKVRADELTAATVPRRYLLVYRRQTVRTPDDGFNEPCLVPTSGPAFQEWAAEIGLDPLAAEQQMLAIEQTERMGLLNVAGDLITTGGGVCPFVEQKDHDSEETPKRGKRKKAGQIVQFQRTKSQ